MPTTTATPTPAYSVDGDTFAAAGGSGYGDSSRNHGSENEIAVGSQGSGITTRSFLKLDLSGIPGHATINDAELSLYVTGWTTGSGKIIALAYPESDWSEGTLTWNNMPTIGEGITTFSPIGIGWVSVDITDAVGDWVSGSRPNYGIALVTSNPIVWFGSREWSPFSPQLIIDYT